MNKWILTHIFLPDDTKKYRVSNGDEKKYEFDNLTDAELFLEEMRGDE